MPSESWKINIRPLIWKRDKQSCVHCKKMLSLNECHIDHINSGVNSTNALSNLRVLCKRCHVLRLDYRHRALISKALHEGLIQSNWREHLWE
ncbi:MULTISPECIES: HNH endonuclease [unclassified Bacillus (in: firmicutes)]|uniref:HNH endonuclease n=1 Tax=unclassified Bacillus (in: firmicutes) TaxID=185979 RepID=UPI0026766330|nr:MULTISPECIES: HNH endonuclease signature motif containing protein [unclassified Bacillus (in: firmicutes)]